MIFNKIKQITFVAFSALLLASCATPRKDFVPPVGLVMTKVKVPLTTNLDHIDIKEDSGSVTSFFFFDFLLTGTSFAWSDCSIAKAAEEGNLKSVAYADYEMFTVLGFFGTKTVTAYGDKK